MPVLGTQTYAAYLDLAEQVKPWLQIDFTDDTHDVALNILINSTCTQVQRIIGGPVPETLYGPADGVGKFDGAASLASEYIMLPRTPVIQVVSVVEYQGSNPVTLSEISDPSTGGDGYQIDYRTGLLTRVVGGIWGRPWYPGSNNVWVTWKAGFNPIPEDLIEATLDWVEYKYRNGQQSSGFQRVTMQQEVEPTPGAGGLYPYMPNRVRAALDSYIKYGMS